jgi:hypothetical protein
MIRRRMRPRHRVEQEHHEQDQQDSSRSRPPSPARLHRLGEEEADAAPVIAPMMVELRTLDSNM